MEVTNDATNGNNEIDLISQECSSKANINNKNKTNDIQYEKKEDQGMFL